MFIELVHFDTVSYSSCNSSLGSGHVLIVYIYGENREQTHVHTQTCKSAMKIVECVVIVGESITRGRTD